MDVHKVKFVALFLLFGTFVLVSKVERADGKVCTRECDTRIAYGICPLEGNKKIDRICTNCCAGKKGCKYFSEDGTFICEGESDYNVGKACPRNCDPRISYGICPLEGNKRTNFDRLCTNCCAGKKGCKYFSEDGTFICEGESEYPGKKACTLNCDPRISYGICPLEGNKRTNNFDRLCTNCCAGKKGCKYFSEDGTFVCEGESEFPGAKACTKECDTRIAFGICPLEGNKRVNFDQICTNCCAGKKGCKYFSADGTFICEGESEYVTKDIAVA